MWDGHASIEAPLRNALEHDRAVMDSVAGQTKQSIVLPVVDPIQADCVEDKSLDQIFVCPQRSGCISHVQAVHSLP